MTFFLSFWRGILAFTGWLFEKKGGGFKKTSPLGFYSHPLFRVMVTSPLARGLSVPGSYASTVKV